MYSALKRLQKYLWYYFTASNGKGHGIHSPFVFDFVRNVLMDDRSFYCFEQIENLRQQLQKNNQPIEVSDYGAGSSKLKSNNRMISSIAKHSLSKKKYAQLLFKITNYYKPNTILEIGSSLGIATCYLGSANRRTKVFTLEGASEIAAIAKQQFDQLQLTNIKLIEGPFENTLPALLQKISALDLVFIDGNHRQEPTLKYFNWLLPKLNRFSILIFDDIHWSAEMEAAWSEIKRHHLVKCSIDLYFWGIVFFNPDFMEQQHFTIRF